MRRKPVPTPSFVVAVLSLIVALGGTGYAATQGSGHLPNIRALVRKDVANYFAAHKAKFIGPRGRNGSNGAPGSALAYAHILANGSLDIANSKNVTSAYESSPTSAEYCLKVAVPFRNAVGSGDGAGTASFVDADLKSSDIGASCTSGAANVLAVVFPPNSGTPAPNPFYIIFN